MTDGRSTPLSHTARFECDALAIRGARALVGEMLTREGWAPLDVERARLVVSELVANAVVHARSPFTLSYSYDGVLRVGVTDDDPHSDPPPEGRRARSYRRHGPAAGGRDQPRLGRRSHRHGQDRVERARAPARPADGVKQRRVTATTAHEPLDPRTLIGRMTANFPGTFDHDDPRRAAELAALDGFVVEAELLDDNRVRLSPCGELDMLTVPALQQRVEGFLSEHTTVVIDLSRLTFVDSAGMRALLLAHGTGKVELKDPSPVVLQTFEVAKVAAMLLGDRAPG